ncbi:DEAD-domain-containing protein [Hysterangium stoloniferum]|nr:DEAD-domain-containing protein [Hysterangium stoloniferum]
MDAPDNVDSQEEGSTTRKRKAEVLEGDGDVLSKKERKRLRKLAKERAADELPTESNATPTEEDQTKQERKEKKKEKRRKLKEQVKKDKKTKKNREDSSTLVETASTSLNATAETTPSPVAASPSDVSAFLTKNRITIHTPEGDDSDVPVLAFDQLDVPSHLRDALLKQGFKHPTPIQSCSWSALLKGKDVVGVAETGSGKTLAFGVPALAKILTSGGDLKSKSKSSDISTLVVAPTRELAMQTYDTLEAIGRPWGIGCLCLYGGVDKDAQRNELQGKGSKAGKVRIVVGTPGRLLDLVEEGCLDLSRVTYLVLDEADRMLDRGFENDIRRIIGNTADQKARQTVMFSATWPESVRRLADTFQRNPVRITVGSEDLTANGRVEQVVEVMDDSREKDSRLLSHLRKLLPKNATTANARVLVFALYKLEASRLTQNLERNGYAVSSLHGDLSQSQRTAALEDFKLGRTRLMVATDVAARGLDIPEVEMVINYTFPLTVEDYVHRIGRTGRGGRTGKSITFFTGEKHEYGLAGELAKVLRESGFSCDGLKKFPMTIKKKEHSAYGAFFKDTSGAGVAKKIKF